MKIGVWTESNNYNLKGLKECFDVVFFNKLKTYNFSTEIPEINLILSENYKEDDYKYENYLLDKKNKIVIHIYMTFNNIIIGPSRRTKKDVCSRCLYSALKNNRSGDLIKSENKHLSTDLDVFSEMTFEETLISIIRKFEDDKEFLKGRIINLSLSCMKATLHNINRNEFCVCSKYNDFFEESFDYMENEEICRNNDLRIKEHIPIEEIKNDIYDPLTGIIANIYKDMNSKFLPMVCVEFNSSEGKIVNGSYGRASTYEASERSAILEMLERYSNMWPKRNIEVIRASYNDIKDKAINPKELILNDEKITKMNNPKFINYSEDLEFDWVYGYSLKNKSRILVPEQVAYYDIDEVKANVNRFIFETSNGAALGGCMQEAILYGLFEVIERDSFMITWYNKLNLVKIDINSIYDEKLRNIIKYVNNKEYDLYLFDSTMENRIPSVICLAINKNSKSIVSSYLAAGCNINPLKAIESALVEVISSIPVYEMSFKSKVEEAESLYDNPDNVLNMDDHVLLYSLKKSIKNYDFLLNYSETKTIEELYPEWNNLKKEKSLTKILQYVIDKVTKYNKDVICVNCSNDLIEKYGLYAAKVLVPGMLPMTFGQQNKRINSERIKKIPVLCGLRSTEVDNFNLYPHPFP